MRDAVLRVQEHFDRTSLAAVSGGRECLLVLVQRIDVGHQALRGSASFYKQVVCDFERVFSAVTPRFLSVALIALNLKLICPNGCQVELWDFSSTSKKNDSAPNGGVSKCLLDCLAGDAEPL